MKNNKKVFISEEQLRKIVREFITTGAVAGYTAPLSGNMNPDAEKDSMRYGGIDPDDMKELVGISYEDIENDVEDKIISPENRNKKNLNMINKRKVRNAGVGVISAVRRNVAEAKQPPSEKYTTTKPLTVKQFTNKFKSDLKVTTKDVKEISEIIDTYEKARKGEFGRTGAENDISNLENKLTVFMKSYIRAYHDFIKMNDLYHEFNISSGIDRNKFFRLLAHDEVVFEQQTINPTRGKGRPKKGEIVTKPKEFIKFESLFKARFHKTIKAAYEEIGDELLKVTPKIKIHEKTRESRQEEGENIEKIATEMELSVGGAHDLIKRSLAKVFVHARITNIILNLEGEVERSRTDLEREIESVSSDLYAKTKIEQQNIINIAKRDIADIASEENLNRILSMPRSAEKTDEIQSEMSLLNLNLNYFSSVSNDLDAVEFYNEIVNIILGQDDIEIIYEFLRTTNNETILDEIINNSKDSFILNLEHKINELTKKAEISIQKGTSAEKSLKDQESVTRHSTQINRNKLELTTILKKFNLSTLNLLEINRDLFSLKDDQTPNIIQDLTLRFRIPEKIAKDIQTKISLINYDAKKIKDIEAKYVSTDLSQQLEQKIDILNRKKAVAEKYFIEMKASCADNPHVAADQSRVEKLLDNYEENFKSHLVLFEFIGKKTREIDIIKKFLLSLATYSDVAEINDPSKNRNNQSIFIAEDMLIENQNLRNKSVIFFSIFKDLEFLKTFLTTHINHKNVIDKFIDLIEFSIKNESFDFEDKILFNEFLRIVSTIIKNVAFDEFKTRVIKNVLLVYLQQSSPTGDEINKEFNALLSNNTFSLEDVKLMRNIIINTSLKTGEDQFELSRRLPIFKYLNGILDSRKSAETREALVSDIESMSREERIELLKQRKEASAKSREKAREFWNQPEIQTRFQTGLSRQILDDYIKLIKTNKLSLERFKENLIIADHNFDQALFTTKMKDLLDINKISQSEYNDLVGLNQSLISNPVIKNALKKSIKKKRFVKQPKKK